MAKRRFEMYHYRQALVRMRLGDSDRQIANPTSRIQRFEDAKPLIGIDPTRKGLHYTGVAASAWVAVIFGGG